MRIAIIGSPHLPIPPQQYGGTEQVITHLINGLKEIGHEVILFAPADSTIDCELVPITETSIFFPKTNRERPAFEAHVKQIEKETAKKLRQLLPRIDIIHSHGFDLKAFSDFPNVTTIHGAIDFKELDYYLKRRNLNYVSISKNQQLSCPELNYVGSVYDAENPADFPPVGEPEDYVCFLGRFDRQKNPHLAIQLALQLGIKIKLAGKIDFMGEGYFEEEVKPYFDHPLVEYLGEIGFDQKVELLSKARCNLHPTGFREPFGLTVLEAAYCGTPTLAINRGSMSEIIKDGLTGALVEDYVEGHYRIQECFDMDRAFIAHLARNRFHYKTMTRDYLKAYRAAIRLKRPAKSPLSIWNSWKQSLPLEPVLSPEKLPE